MKHIPVGWIFLAVCLIFIGILGFGSLLYFQNRAELKELHQILKTVETQTPDTRKPTKNEARTPRNPHAETIKKLDETAGLQISTLATRIIQDEGKRATPYLDTTGAVTIGVGRNLTGNGISVAELHAILATPNYKHLLQHTRIQNRRIYIQTLLVAEKIFEAPLTEHDIQLLLVHDLSRTVTEAKSVFGQHWERISASRQLAILDVMFNLGLPRFKTFHKFIEAVKKGEWKTAASEILLSQASRKNPLRYHRIATIIQTNHTDSLY